MKNSLWSIFSIGFLVSALMAATASAAAPLKVGDPAPDFELKGSDGSMHKLSDLKGKTVVLAWFPKASTPGCTAECKSIAANGEKLRKYDAVVFTISTDEADMNARFAREVGADYPILSDPSKEVAKAYGVVNEERKVPFRWTFYIGKDGKILAIDKEVKTASHGEDVAAKLKELGVPESKS